MRAVHLLTEPHYCDRPATGVACFDVADGYQWYLSPAKRDRDNCPPVPESAKVAGCGKKTMVLHCEHDGSLYGVPVRCRSRYCLRCARKDSMDWVHWVRRQKFKTPTMLTLTTLPVPIEQLRHAVDLARRSLPKLLRKFRRYLPAGFGSLELKLSDEGHGWLVHWHTMVELAAFVDMAELQAYWFKLTGAYIMEIHTVKAEQQPKDMRLRAALRKLAIQDACCEVVKYTTDPKTLEMLTPGEVDALGNATRHRRLRVVWGADVLLETKETTQHDMVCPKCGSRLSFVGVVPAARCDVPMFDFSACSRASPPALPPVLNAN